MKNKIVNIINFIRAVEPRRPVDLHKPVIFQMELAKQHKLPTTWLLQYDALQEDFYTDLLRTAPEGDEVGIWFEVVQPLMEACGIPWRGRYPWDWFTNVGFPVAYTPRERELLADEFIRLFREKFGFTPRSMGSWFFDAHLLGYLADKYNIEAACNCKDQWGTDGYTLWGGYWANGYYPCRKNSYLPAQTLAEQISVPVFRMLGSDPIYQYEADPERPNGQTVITLEPYVGLEQTVPAGGGVPSWVDWFFRNEFTDPVMSMGYAQVGQENPFGYDLIHEGLEYQYALVAKLRDEGKISVATLGDTGRWFKNKFPQTPASCITALEDWQNTGRESIWYMTRFGRINLARDNEGALYIRDWQINSESYAEPFLNAVCRTTSCAYTALPLCDGTRWQTRLQFYADGEILRGNWDVPRDRGNDILQVTAKDGKLELVLEGNRIRIKHQYKELALKLERKNTCGCNWHKSTDGRLQYTFGFMHYCLTAENAQLYAPDNHEMQIVSSAPEFLLDITV
ncbi:MAG: hypothetical protein IJV89_04045 [Lentisphaeria bacterium]|nr:hypothetical protein [Lentisphaeria bacterium]